MEAQKRLLGEGVVHSIQDLYGKVGQDYILNKGPVSGVFSVSSRNKRQRRTRETERIQVQIAIDQGTESQDVITIEVNSGTFVFEIFAEIPNMPRIHHANIKDAEGNQWRMDERVWKGVTFMDYVYWHELRGGGEVGTYGLGNYVLDKFGTTMMDLHDKPHDRWIQATMLTDIIVAIAREGSIHWNRIIGAMHGTLRGCFLWQDHWSLLEIKSRTQCSTFYTGME